ncbi:hypothetical protein SprV_0200895800 [Sparganum proliferum]
MSFCQQQHTVKAQTTAISPGRQHLPDLHIWVAPSTENATLCGSSCNDPQSAVMSQKQTPRDFLKLIIGRPVVVKLNSGADYRGVLISLDGYMNVVLEQTEEYSTALAVLGRTRRQHQDWFDDNATFSNLLAEKNRLHKACVNRPTDDNKAAFFRSRRLVQQRLQEMQDSWTARKAEKIQRRQILQRWAEHFKGVLNCPSTISDAAIARLPQMETNADLDLLPFLHEIIKAVQQPSSRKAPGSNAIPADIYKHGGLQLMDHLAAHFREKWRQGEVPQDFKSTIIMPLYKRKGNGQICDNHRGVSLTNIAGKIFVRILLNRTEHRHDL